MNLHIVTNFILLVVLMCSSTEYYGFSSANSDDGEVIVRCVARERKSLLKFKEGLVDKHGMLSSWGKEKDCCQWEGVECNNKHGRVIALRLVRQYWPPGYHYLGGEINSALLELHSLKVLDLSGNDFGTNKFPEFICSMSSLQHLYLRDSNFYGTLPSHKWNLTNLKTLDLWGNRFSGNVPSRMWNLTDLNKLDLSGNRFSGIIPPQIGNLINLERLDLSSNQFSGNLPSEIGNLTSLEKLYLSYNHFSGALPPQLWRLTNLQQLILSENYLTSSPTDSLLNMSTDHVAHSLTTLDLQSNKLTRLPSCIWKLLELEELLVSSNSLEETITEADLFKLTNLKVLDLSFNSLTLDISPDWTPPFQLREIIFSGCKMGPHFPLWLQTQNNFIILDLSLTGISGEVPRWFSRIFLSKWFTYLNISHNQLSGTLSDFSSIEIQYLDVSSNNFSGPIPFLSEGTEIFRISRNMFSGSLSFDCSIPYSLVDLDLSNNHLSGKLPSCWKNMHDLTVVNVENNRFSGEIPHDLGSLSRLLKLHLANNSFSGQFPSTLKNCKQLKLIDIGDNMLTGSITTWIGEYRETMVYLIIRNNKFHGSIPPHICRLYHIQVLDLSGNDISGNIPPCFDNFIYLVEMNTSSKEYLHPLNYTYQDVEYTDNTIVPWKRALSEYGQNIMLLKLIDLSRNRLVGNIPRSFSSLRALRSLNLSGNRLTGIIDPDIGRMSSLDSLDLSNNHLSGPISISMTKINFLGVLDLANNNLSGEIPIGGQLHTFTASAYAGNIGLCGSPLPLCSVDKPDPSTNRKVQNVDDGGILSLSFLKEIGIPIILGFIVGFWGVVGSLIIKESWRRLFYKFWGDIGDWLYVRATIFWAKLFRRI